MGVDVEALDAFLADPATPGGDLNPTGNEVPAAAPAAPEASAPAASEEASIPSREAAPATPSADAKVEAAVAATGQTEDKWDPETRKYIESLRSESAKYRQRGQRYNEVFDGYEDDAVDEWLSLASTLREDPKAAAARFQEIAQAILEANTEPEPVVDHAAEAEVMTRAEFERALEAKLAERDKAADLARRTAQIEADARVLGYEPGSESYEELLYTASRLPNGSIQAAHEKIAARRQAVIDQYVASLGTKPAPEVPAAGAPASGERKISSFKQANEALDAWLAGL